MPSGIEDYALIGDLQSCALVARNGSIDWMCVPRFDSPACFAALLGEPGHGRWLVAPRSPARAIRRRYRRDTLILETEIETDEGRVRIIDFMPIRTDVVDLFRIVEGIEGSVPMLCTFGLADVLALQGKHDEAAEIFQRLLSLRNDVGLLAEQYDPVARRQLGNFPRAFSHVGLINTARNLHRHGGPAEDRQANR